MINDKMLINLQMLVRPLYIEKQAFKHRLIKLIRLIKMGELK
jgi:hypothetical protein